MHEMGNNWRTVASEEFVRFTNSLLGIAADLKDTAFEFQRDPMLSSKLYESENSPLTRPE